jgi:hypothetical protein
MRKQLAKLIIILFFANFFYHSLLAEEFLKVRGQVGFTHSPNLKATVPVGFPNVKLANAKVFFIVEELPSSFLESNNVDKKHAKFEKDYFFGLRKFSLSILIKDDSTGGIIPEHHLFTIGTFFHDTGRFLDLSRIPSRVKWNVEGLKESVGVINKDLLADFQSDPESALRQHIVDLLTRRDLPLISQLIFRVYKNDQDLRMSMEDSPHDLNLPEFFLHRDFTYQNIIAYLERLNVPVTVKSLYKYLLNPKFQIEAKEYYLYPKERKFRRAAFFHRVKCAFSLFVKKM